MNISQLDLNQITLDRKIYIDDILKENYSVEHFFLTNLLREMKNGEKIKEIMKQLNDEVNFNDEE